MSALDSSSAPSPFPARSPFPAPDDATPCEPRVSIVIPVFNRLALTRACLESLARHTPAGWAEIIVVDNGSTDGTAEYLGARAHGVRVITHPENRGYARASNAGAAAARTPYVLFLNNDTEAHAGWLEPLVYLLDHDPRVGAAGSKLLFPDGTVQHAGVMILEDQRASTPFQARHVHYAAPADLPDANRRRRYQALTAACLLVRKTAFDEVQGFDEGYWNGYEDVDLCFKLQELEHLLVYEPASVLTHHESMSGPERFSKVPENIARLHGRWAGRVAPDAVIDRQGKFAWTEAARIRDHRLAGSATPVPRDASAPRQAGLVSIVMLTFNQLDVTKQCLASIERNTPEPHEIVFVDNGSSDGTVSWLREQVALHADYRLVENARNEGFARGCNQGIGASRGEYVLLLNNDVVVTEHWLSGLLECLESTPDAGIAGPMTNEISGRQRVELIGYEALRGLPAFAADWRERNRHQRTPAPRVVGFCMLFRHELVREIGLLDEVFGTGNFEDDDLCRRSELAGRRNVIAGDVFIHHHGSRSFVGNRIDPRAAMARNRALFQKKWQRRAREAADGARVLALEALEKARDLDDTGRLRDGVELCLEAIRVTPSATAPYLVLADMLVRNGEHADALEVLQNLPCGWSDARARLLAAQARLGLGQVATALSLVESIDGEPDLRARALNLKGLLAYQAGDHETSAACFNAAIAADRGFGEPYANLGALLWARDPGRQALELFERGLVLSPGSPDTLESYSTAAKTLGEAAHAAAVVREARGLYPVHRGLTFALIDLLLASEQPEAAMLEIEGALEWFPVDDGFVRAALAVRARVGPRGLPAGGDARGRLSLCMIVKNEAGNVVRCLRSAIPLVDELVVVDTGSTDGTAELATALGARVVAWEWTGDFAAARNAALAAANGEWVLVLDADESLAATDLPRLRALVRDDDGTAAAGYVMTTRNYSTSASTAGWRPNDGTYAREEAGTGWYPSRKVRLFRNDPRIRFEGELHEVVEHSLARHGLPIWELDAPVHHYGPLDPSRERAKAETYYELAKRKLARAPEDAAALFELAVQAGAVGAYDEAIALWNRYVQRPRAARLALAWMNLGHALLETHQFELSSRASRRALALDGDRAEAAFNLALCALCRGRCGETLAQATKLLDRRPAHLPALGLLTAASLLAHEEAGLAKACAAIAEQGERPAAYLQAHAARLRRAGRGADALRLLDAARESWKKTLMAEGLDASDEQVELLLQQATDITPEPLGSVA